MALREEIKGWFSLRMHLAMDDHWPLSVATTLEFS